MYAGGKTHHLRINRLCLLIDRYGIEINVHDGDADERNSTTKKGLEEYQKQNLQYNAEEAFMTDRLGAFLRIYYRFLHHLILSR